MAGAEGAAALPLAALLPSHPEFDEEAELAATSLPVLRFAFGESPVLQCAPERPCRALHRGFMLSSERYRVLFESLAPLGVHLVVAPEDYERVHYYPLAYPALASISPRAAWSPVDADAVRPEAFEDAIAEVFGWGCRHVVLKDFVKSAKEEGNRFMCAAVDEDLGELACELVRLRGRRFNRGIVFKERVELERYATRGGYVTNEWRLWFGDGELIAAVPNSFQDESCDKVPDAMLAAAGDAARALGSPYLTIDVAETADGWRALEAGDGGASGPAPCQDMAEHWATLARRFQARSA